MGSTLGILTKFSIDPYYEQLAYILPFMIRVICRLAHILECQK